MYLCPAEPPVKILGNSDQNDNQEMVAGDDLILACELSQTNVLVQWLFNDKPLVPDSRTYIECYGTLHKLIISDVQPSDSGKYICDAVDDKMVTIVKVEGINYFVYSFFLFYIKNITRSES